jgi:hypothetical protein
MSIPKIIFFRIKALLPSYLLFGYLIKDFLWWFDILILPMVSYYRVSHKAKGASGTSLQELIGDFGTVQ